MVLPLGITKEMYKSTVDMVKACVVDGRTGEKLLGDILPVIKQRSPNEQKDLTDLLIKLGIEHGGL